MRIQHNILAMNAYRNYTNNTNALGKNLEKLSSGYKINRAGDDAAGLAISEKMRAQITGLNAAQKNVKDGISLVKTAEGALSEVHDMLNRMTYLATQSANGTYDNETDRYQLQKEVEQLKAEINRIADSSNFNGIKLLDGSMDTSAITGVTYDAVSDTKLHDMFTRGWDNWKATNQQDVDGTQNRLEAEGGKKSKAGFQISLDGVSVDLKEGQEFTLKFGDASMTFTADRTGVFTASQIAAKLAEEINKEGGPEKISFGGRDYTVKAEGKVLTFTIHDDFEDEEFKLNDQATVTWEVDGKVGNIASGAKASVINATDNDGISTAAATGKAPVYTATGSVSKGNAGAELDFTGITGKDIIGATVAIGSVTYEFVAEGGTAKTGNEKIEVKTSDTADDLAMKLVDAMKTKMTTKASAVGIKGGAGPVVTISFGSNVVSVNAIAGDGSTEKPKTMNESLKVSDLFPSGLSQAASAALSAMAAGGTLGATEISALKEAFDAVGEVEVKVAGKSTKINFKKVFEGVDTTASWGAIKDKIGQNILGMIKSAAKKQGYQVDEISFAGQVVYTREGYGSTAGTSMAAYNGDVISWKLSLEDEPSGKYGGTINTGLQNVTDNIKGDTAGLANTEVDFFSTPSVNAWQDGAQIKIGDTVYTMAIGEDSKFKNVKNVVDLTDYEAEDRAYDVAAQRLTVAAKDNSIFTVGHNGSGATTLQQRTEAKDTTDMSTREKVLSYLGVSIANADSVESAVAGNALTLQIGDTSDSYNQLKVSIGDAHTKALGIDGIDISTQEGAAAAIAKIRTAINEVSDIRGTLGATQNRLEHTANNLSVMAENIQDAESTIRDTDVAEEMMSYVKNNILIQSAQAMLAQANQIPQGVLQLLG